MPTAKVFNSSEETVVKTKKPAKVKAIKATPSIIEDNKDEVIVDNVSNKLVLQEAIDEVISAKKDILTVDEAKYLNDTVINQTEPEFEKAAPIVDIKFNKALDAFSSYQEESFKPGTTSKGISKPFNKTKQKGPYPTKQDDEPAKGTYPEHMMDLARIVKNNAEIRRFTALGILNYLLQKGEIRGTKRFVQFKWNKFVVKSDHLSKEYAYAEPFFINCLAASFASFAASAQNTINTFTLVEMDARFEDVSSNDEIARIHYSVQNR